MHQGKKREQKFAGTRQILTTLKLPAPRCRSSPNHDFYWFVSLILACCKASVANHLASDCEQNWDTCWAVELICPDKTIALSLCDEKNEIAPSHPLRSITERPSPLDKFGALRKLSPELIRKRKQLALNQGHKKVHQKGLTVPRVSILKRLVGCYVLEILN